MGAQENTSLEREDTRVKIDTVRHAVLIGLSAFGELERLRNLADLSDRTQRKYPDGMRPLDVSGDANEISNFADALRILEGLDFDNMKR